MAELLLACPHCQRVVVIQHGDPNDPLDEHRSCYRCGREMVETERDEEARIICPKVGDARPEPVRWPIQPEKNT